MTTVRAATKREAISLLETAEVRRIELDYETGWLDAPELGRLGERAGIKVEYRGHESVAVTSPGALANGLRRPKVTFRQRNLYCLFELANLPAAELESLETKAGKLGDYILAGHLIREIDVRWSEE